MPHAQNASSISTRQEPVRLRVIQSAEPPPVSDDVVHNAFGPTGRIERLEAAAQRWLIEHSITLLRLSLGAVFLAFGVLKLFPGVSPAENLVKATTSILTLGLVPGSVAMIGIAALECLIGVCLISGRFMRIAIYLLAIELVGILSPLVVLQSRMFSGPHHAPTLEGQYVLKDIIVVAATLVLAATLRGARLTSRPHPRSSTRD